MMRASNHLVGVINFLTFLLSIPIIAGGIWLSSRANNVDCLKFLQWPIIAIGACIMVVSLAGIAGACYRNTLLMRFYIGAMFFIIAALVGFVIFAYAVTARGSGRSVPNRAYKDYYLPDYSGWLKDHVASQKYWTKISACVRDSKACGRMGSTAGGLSESADLRRISSVQRIRIPASASETDCVMVEVLTGHRYSLLAENINPTENAPQFLVTHTFFFPFFFLKYESGSLQSGCCKPPTECGYTYVNETVSSAGSGLAATNNQDCARWSKDQELLCYACNSCKAGVLASLKKSWRKVSFINIVVLILLVIFYLIAIAANRNNRRMDNDEPYNDARMTKSSPSHFQF